MVPCLRYPARCMQSSAVINMIVIEKEWAYAPWSDFQTIGVCMNCLRPPCSVLIAKASESTGSQSTSENNSTKGSETDGSSMGSKPASDNNESEAGVSCTSQPIRVVKVRKVSRRELGMFGITSVVEEKTELVSLDTSVPESEEHDGPIIDGNSVEHRRTHVNYDILLKLVALIAIAARIILVFAY